MGREACEGWRGWGEGFWTRKGKEDRRVWGRDLGSGDGMGKRGMREGIEVKWEEATRNPDGSTRRVGKPRKGWCDVVEAEV